MTEQQGLFTVPTSLYLTMEQRGQLEHLVRERRMDVADLVSIILVEHPPKGQPQITPSTSLRAGDHRNLNQIPTRVYLTPEQRAQFDQLVRERKIELADLVTQSVAAYLDTLPSVPLEEPAPTPAPDLRERRTDLARLKARRDAAGADAPAWLHAYIAEMEAELRRLEG
jgi:hypothetical protein